MNDRIGPIVPMPLNPPAIPRLNIPRLDVPIPPAVASLPSDRYICRVLDLSTARNAERLLYPGNLVWAVAGSDATATLDLRFDDDQADAIPVVPGFAISGLRFGKLFITHSAQAGKTLTLFVAQVNEAELAQR